MNDFIGTYQIDKKAVSDLSAVYDDFSHMAEDGRCFDFDGELAVDPSIKQSKDLYLSLVPSELLVSYMLELKKCITLYKEEYEWSDRNQAKWCITEDINLQVYPPGGGYKTFHFEKTGGRTVNRHLVFMTFLSTIPPEHGGGTEFFYQRRVLPCKAGLTAIWPAEWTHTHRGIIAPAHEKRIVTGWVSYA